MKILSLLDTTFLLINIRENLQNILEDSENLQENLLDFREYLSDDNAD